MIALEDLYLDPKIYEVAGDDAAVEDTERTVATDLETKRLSNAIMGSTEK